MEFVVSIDFTTTFSKQTALFNKFNLTAGPINILLIIQQERYKLISDQKPGI